MEKEEHKMNDKASYIHREPCKGGAKYFLLLLIIILLSFFIKGDISRAKVTCDQLLLDSHFYPIYLVTEHPLPPRTYRLEGR